MTKIENFSVSLELTDQARLTTFKSKKIKNKKMVWTILF